MSRSRTSLRLVAGVLVVVILAAVAYLLRDPLPTFMARRSELATIQERAPAIVDGSELQTVRLTAKSGLAVDLSVRRHLGDTGRRMPLVVILGGHLTGAEAARIVGETPGVVVAAVSYPFTGDPRPSARRFLLDIPKIRAAFLDTPPALMLALDYLLRRPDVDTTRVEGLGVSLGAPFVTIAGALDSRIHRVWSIHGSGGSYTPLEASMRRTIGFAPLRAVSAAIANVIIAGPRLAPERWVSRIAPRTFIMVNATDDERFSRSSVEVLYRGAAEPKEMIWMSGGHIHGDQPTIQRLVAIVLSRVRESTSRTTTELTGTAM
ncbi:MAG: hypothetical protein WD825_11770 [Gemmatimonadaceae bacterium]